MAYSQLLSVILLVLLSKSSLAVEEFIINLPAPVKASSFSNEVQQFFIDVYEPVGIFPEFVFIPADRSFKLIRKGLIHAEGYRTSFVGDPLGREIRLETPIFKIKVGLFCSSANKCRINPEQVYAIQSGFNYGLEICQNLAITCKQVADPGGLAKLLDTGLADAAISPYPAYDKYLCLSKHNQFFYRELEGLDFNIYHYTTISDERKRQALMASLDIQLKRHQNLFERFVREPDLSHCQKQI